MFSVIHYSIMFYKHDKSLFLYMLDGLQKCDSSTNLIKVALLQYKDYTKKLHDGFQSYLNTFSSLLEKQDNGKCHLVWRKISEIKKEERLLQRSKEIPWANIYNNWQ